MRIGIVGGGYAGIIASLLIKKKNPSWDVSLFEGSDKLGKKLSMTGSGRCNLGNKIVDEHSYNRKEAYDVYQNCPLDKQIAILKEFGILTTEFGRYVFPNSLSAKSYLGNLVSVMEKLGVRIRLDHKLTEYHHSPDFVSLFFANGMTYQVDRVVFACGGASFAKTGSDGSIFPILRDHKYSIGKIKPGLNGILTREETKSVQNERLRCKVILKDDGKIYYEEEGEIIFKADGINGICAMDAQSVIARHSLKNPTLSFDILPQFSFDEIVSYVENNQQLVESDFLKGLFSTQISNYIKKRLKKFDAKTIAHLLKSFDFSYKGDRPLDEAICIVGGVGMENLDGLQSLIEKKVYFAGEMLDFDGMCGGYSLMLAFAGAFKVANDIC